jgi:hypothetical protein
LYTKSNFIIMEGHIPTATFPDTGKISKRRPGLHIYHIISR